MTDHLTSPAQEPPGGEERERLPHPQARRAGYRWHVAQLIALVMFVGLAVPAARFPYFAFDPYFTEEVQEARTPLLDQVMYAISVPGFAVPGAIVVVATIVILAVGRFRTEALFVALTSLGDVLGQVVKVVVGRPRPDAGLVSVLAHEGSNSFPSAHALHYVVFFGFLVYLALTLLRPGVARTLLAAVLALPIVLVGISRVYLGDHWLSDVLGGYLIGGLWLSLHIQIYRWFKGHFELVPHPPFVRLRSLEEPV